MSPLRWIVQIVVGIGQLWLALALGYFRVGGSDLRPWVRDLIDGELVIERPGWMDFLVPVAALPIWLQAVIVSAAVAGLVRWVWRVSDPGDES